VGLVERSLHAKTMQINLFIPFDKHRLVTDRHRHRAIASSRASTASRGQNRMARLAVGLRNKLKGHSRSPKMAVAPPGGEASPYGDVQKLCNYVCDFIVMELLRITRQIHCKAVEQSATLIHRQYNRDWGDFVL